MKTFSSPMLFAFLSGIAVASVVIFPAISYLSVKLTRSPDPVTVVLATNERQEQDTRNTIVDEAFITNSVEDESVSEPEQRVHDVATVAKTTPLERAFMPLSMGDNRSKYLKNATSLNEHSSPLSPLIPVLWHVPKAGGSSLKSFIFCLDLPLAAQTGKFLYADNGAKVAVNEHPSLEVLYRKNFGYYVNVDVSSLDGIRAAHEIGFPDWIPKSEGRVVIVTSLIQTAAELLFPAPHEAATEEDDGANDMAKGVLLAVLRDPIDRQVSLFHYLQRASHESTYHPEWKNLTIVEWNGGEDNWMVRTLSGVLEGDSPNRQLNEKDLQKAKDILSNYSLIGFTDRMGETLDRFGEYLGWKNLSMWDQCRAKYGSTKRNSASGSYSAVEKFSEEWHHIAKKNQLDLELFQHAKALFEKQ